MGEQEERREETAEMPDSGPSGEVFIVDDDPAVRETLSLLFSNAGYSVVRFAEGAAFLRVVKERNPICIILDVHIPGKTGIDILKELNAQDYPAPIFIMSGQGDIAMAVDAIKNGALDFIEKPFRGSDVVTRVREAVEASDRQKRAVGADGVKAMNFPGREPLTSREQDVLSCIVKGESNKEAARRLGISPRTIEVHRSRIMEKLDAKNAADLIRIVMSEGRAHP
jgi:FixJ family two-component response regulator